MKSNAGPIALSRLARLLADLVRQVKGQDELIGRLVGAVLRRETGAIPPGGPRDAFLFAGPTGVGKTLLAETLAITLFGKDKLIRFDCSEFKSLSKYDELFGTRGSDPGRLAQAHKKVSSGVWLFDEIEKGHPEFVDLFLQAVSAARLTPANGQTLDLSELYIIVTTNLGTATIIGREHLPFASIEAHVARTIETAMRPELLGRFGKPFVFRPLSREAQTQIASDMVMRILSHNRDQSREIRVGPGVVEFLLCRAYSRRLGARPLIQTITELVGNAIARNLMSGGNGSGVLLLVGDELKLVQ